MHANVLPFSALFDLIENSLPLALIEKRSRERLRAFSSLYASNFPIRLVAFECSLQETDLWGDMHILLPNPSQELLKFPATMLFKDPAWEAVTALLQDWNRSGYLTEHGVDRVIIGLDIGSEPNWPPQPNLFFHFRRDISDPVTLAIEAFSRLLHKPMPNAMLTSLHSYTPETIGFLLARSSSMRISIQAPSPDVYSLTKLFPQSHLTGIFDSLKDATQGDLARAIYPIRVGFDIGEEGMIYPKMGVRLHTHTSTDLLDSLSLKGFLNEPKKKALLSWVAHHTPDNLRRAVNHLKFVCTPHQNLWTKAYLLVEYLAQQPAKTL